MWRRSARVNPWRLAAKDGFALYPLSMQQMLRQKLNADEFLAWADRQERGRYQLAAGKVLAMAPERAEHGDVKRRVANALEAAIRAKGFKCQAFVGSLGVKIDSETVFEPDALVNCGERVPRASLIAPNPVIVAEVVSPSSERQDLAVKFRDYFRHPSVQHYLLIMIEGRSVLHHKRGENGTIVTAILGDTATIALEPPGIEVPVAAMFGEDYAGTEA